MTNIPYIRGEDLPLTNLDNKPHSDGAAHKIRNQVCPQTFCKFKTLTLFTNSKDLNFLSLSLFWSGRNLVIEREREREKEVGDEEFKNTRP